MTASYTFTAPLWQWQAKEGTAEPGSWCFVTVPLEDSQDIRDGLVAPPRGFGSVRVAVEAGGSRWETSLFPDGASAATCCRSRRRCGSPSASRRATT